MKLSVVLVVLGIQVLINVIFYFSLLHILNNEVCEFKKSIYGMGVELSNQNMENFAEIKTKIKNIPKEITVKNVLNIP
jgi:hypothetical protein